MESCEPVARYAHVRYDDAVLRQGRVELIEERDRVRLLGDELVPHFSAEASQTVLEGDQAVR